MFELDDMPAPTAAEQPAETSAGAATTAPPAAGATAAQPPPQQQLHIVPAGKALAEPLQAPLPRQLLQGGVAAALGQLPAPPLPLPRGKSAAAPLQQPLQQPAQAQPVLPQQRTGEVLQGALPGTTIRKVVMRGRRAGSVRGGKAAADNAAGLGAKGAKGTAGVDVQQPPLERRWVPPGWTSPARASQAA